MPRAGHDFGRMSVFPTRGAPTAGEVNVQGQATFASRRGDAEPVPVANMVSVSEKSVEGGEQNYVDDGLVERAPVENGPDGGTPPAPPAPSAPPAPPAPAPAPPAAPAPAPAAAKKAGVVSFTVKWSKHAGAGAADAKLRLDYNATFKKDAQHDPALAEFRQSVMSTWDVTSGPHSGRKGTTAPMHDDNYSRADDLAGNTINDVAFYSNDNPGYDDLDKDDVLDYSFTAEQTIIDTSKGNAVIATRGPHTGTVKGKHPRTYTGVPVTLS